MLKRLEKLILASDFATLQNELNKNKENPHLFDTFDDDGESLFHRLVKSTLDEKSKILVAYKLSDAGLDINLQNETRKQTCLHLAAIYGLPELTYCLLQNSADLTIVDNDNLCAYNYAKRLQDKEVSKKIIQSMQSFYPTYWIAIDNSDIDSIRRLINSWCRFRVNRRGKSLIEYTTENKFKAAYDLFMSLEAQMDLCFAVMACNVSKADEIIKNNRSKLRVDFKNMKEKGATIFYYAVKHNNIELLKILLDLKPNILNEYIRDDSDIDYPVYFFALASKLPNDCIQLITPEDPSLDISQIFYRGKSVLRYAIEIGLGLDILEYILDPKFCSKELITAKDPEWLTSQEYALKMDKIEYVDLIDKVTVNYILNSKSMRQQLALNGFDFNKKLYYNGKELKIYAKENALEDLVAFLEHVDEYQSKIDEFHKRVEQNDYYGVKATYKIEDCDQFKDLFSLNLLFSKTKGSSQSIFHKCVLNGYYQILELVLELMGKETTKTSPKLDSIRDHCYRTAFHYACGLENNKRMCHLLSHYGLSDNVYDKDGQTPLDFSERAVSDELKELINMHRVGSYKSAALEPNPWTWKVWTRIQSEKDTLKQIIVYSMTNNAQTRHGHGHSHSHHHHQHYNHDSNDSIDDDDTALERDSSCHVL